MMDKGRRHAVRERSGLQMKTSRIVYLCLAVLYLLIVCGATIYSLTAYRSRLPQVELTQADGGKIPISCLLKSPDGMIINTVERQDGPWGKRYVIKQLTVFACQPVDEETVFVYEAVSNENPIVSGGTAEFLYDGMEVRIS